MKLPRSKKWLWGIAPLVVALGVIYYLLLPVAEVATIRRGTALSAVYGTIRIEPAFIVRVRAQNSGFIRLAESFSAGRGAIGQNVGANLRAFIATKASDVALETDSFLKLKGSTVGKKPRPEFKQLATFLARNRYPIGPEVVYWENDSLLLKAGTNIPITGW